MNKEKISQIIGQIDARYIDEAALSGAEGGENRLGAPSVLPKRAEKGANRTRRIAAAACLALVLALGSATYAYAAEAEAYRTAVEFFEENGLPTEGLSRTEIKAVYRDIATRRFVYSKTPEVIRQVVPGWEIRQEGSTPEELAALWERKDREEPGEGVELTYRRDYRYRHTERQGEVLEACILECLRDGESLWTAEFTHFYLDGYAQVSGGLAVWGWNETRSSGERTYAWLAYVDEGGNILWEQPLTHGFQMEYIASVLQNEDGTWAVISRGDLNFLCLSAYDGEGRELRFRQTEVGNLGVWNAARLGDGYIVQLGSWNTGDYAHLYRLDREGNVIDDYAYEGEDCVYHLVDMAEFGGQVYLSAYAVPPQHDEGGRDEIGNILDYVISHGWKVSEEELTPIVRENYTAVLLLCDPEGGVPQTFYSVSGSLGGRLKVRETDALEWDVESVASAYFSPATSAFSIGGSCRVYRYVFDASGVLTGQTDTGETAPYYR